MGTEQTARTGRRWLRWGGLVLVMSLAWLSGARAGGLAAQPPGQTGPAVQVLPRQTGPAVAEYVPGEVVVLFQPSTMPGTDVAATAQVNQTLAGAGVSATIAARLEDPSGFLLQLTGPN